MLDGQKVISIPLPISAFVREVIRLADHQQEHITEEKQKLIKRIKAEKCVYFYNK